jgi:methylmalonyl-CoA/ethylmalonyl-CoA epimerase
MVKNGARLVVKPVKGFDDRLIAFLLLNMRNTNCNFIELVEIKK